MSHAFADIAFTPSIKAAQQRDGSRGSCAGNLERAGETLNLWLGEAEADFIGAQRSFCPQHIPPHFGAEDVRQTLADREARIAELEAQLAGRA